MYTKLHLRAIRRISKSDRNAHLLVAASDNGNLLCSLPFNVLLVRTAKPYGSLIHCKDIADVGFISPLLCMDDTLGNSFSAVLRWSLAGGVTGVEDNRMTVAELVRPP